MPRLSDAPGKIYVLNLASGKDPTELHIKGDFDAASFGPHGISVYTDEGISACLFHNSLILPTLSKAVL